MKNTTFIATETLKLSELMIMDIIHFCCFHDFFLGVLHDPQYYWYCYMYRLSGSSGRSHSNSLDWTLFSSAHSDPMTSDVVAPSPWIIFGCQNGKCYISV